MTEFFHITKILNKAHYTSIQTASSSPGRRKGTFGTPIGIFFLPQTKYSSIIKKRKNEILLIIYSFSIK